MKKTTKNTLANLNTIAELAKKKINNLENERLNYDLETIIERINKKEYQKGSFSKNKFNVPDRTKEFYVYTNFYCDIGKNWAKLLKPFNVNKYSEIVDLCPGFTPKIELALFYLGYKNQLTVIDKKISFLGDLEKFTKLFNPHFKLVKKKLDLFSNFKSRHQFIIANHIIDDLAMDHFAKKYEFKIDDIYQNENCMKNFWQKIIADKEKNISEISDLIAEIFIKIVDSKGYLFISQYKSYMEKLLNMNSVPYFNKKVLKVVVDKLSKSGFTNDRAIVKKALANYKGHFKAEDCYVLKKN